MAHGFPQVINYFCLTDCVDGSCVKDSGVEGVGLEGGGVAGVGLEGGDVAGSGMTEDSERALDSSRLVNYCTVEFFSAECL